MKILFVLNSFYATGNGLSASARRTVNALKEAGEEVRVLSGPNHDPNGPQPDYALKEFFFPIFQPLITTNGYQFASTDTRIVANQIMMNLWKNLCFNEWKYVQCPTQNVKDRLEANGFKADLRVISNGLVPDACIRVPHQNQPFLLICIGRLSGEKSPYTLLEAMKHSSYAKNIQLFFAGKGPEEKKVRKMAKKLYEDEVVAYEPLFDFMDRDGLRNLAAKADLAIHCATIEVEGLSIMEAMQQGVVPIIADGPITGTHRPWRLCGGNEEIFH